jgi:hypothetical protein
MEVILRSLPVLGAPGRSPSCFPNEVRRDTTLSPSADLIFDVVISGSRFPEELECLLQSFPPRKQPRKGSRIVIKVVFRYQFIHRIQIAFVNLLVKPAYERLVGLG